jgi:hypothetical protein
MPKAKAPQPQPAKQQPKAAAPAAKPAAPAPKPKAPAPAAPPPKPAASDPFEALWQRFCVEANFSPETLEAEASVVREDIAKLEERLAERRADLEVITRRETNARDKMAALLKIGFSPDAVVSAMKVEFKGRKAVRKEKELEANDDEKAAVLDVLDREGQPLAEVAKHSGIDPKELLRVLTVLITAGKVKSQGERKGKVFMLA